VQGCDIEPIAPRSEQQWTGLLGEHRLPALRELAAAGDPLDEAATRIWCAIECAKKALGGDVEALEIGRRKGGAALVSCKVGSGSVEVLTIAMSLTRLPRKVVAMLVTPAQATVAAPGRAEVAAPATLLVPAPQGGLLDAPLDAHGMACGPQGQPKPCFRFRATFKDTTTLRNSVDLPVYARWMGDIRELAIANFAHHLVPDFASGRWGMVTNESDIRVFGDAHCLDVIEGRMYISRAYGKFGSSIDMHFEWLRIRSDGEAEPIALSTMATTWVEIKGHGIVEVQPFPPYLQQFVSANLPGGSACGTPCEAWPANTGAEWARAATLGSVLHEAPRGPKIEPELLRQVFATSSAESNLVGNVYFANYYHWQKRLIDNFLHGLSPELYTAGGRVGEFHWRHSQIRHLREAMPFDRIEVVMALKRLSSHGICLHFDFYRLTGGSERIKLAYGECEAAWVGKGSQTPSQMPEPYRLALLAELPPSL
jgi:acyl-CoA thioesterase FadM